MKRFSLLAALLLAACSQGPRPEGPRFNVAQPSEVIAAEIAFARLAQERGQWTAFRETAAADAVMFVPQPVVAQAWLRGRADPPQAVRWQPHQVWSSCDGTLAVTRGAWQTSRANGYFTTVWERQADGHYKWIMDQGDDLAQPLTAPEMIAASVADCRSHVALAAGATSGFELPAHGGGASKDNTLAYGWEVRQDLGRSFTVTMIKDGSSTEVLRVAVAPPQPTP